MWSNKPHQILQSSQCFQSVIFNVSYPDAQTVKSTNASVHLSEYYYKPPAE